MKLISQGAEAKIIYTGRFIIKHRIKKSYRNPELDKKLIKSRTKSEAKLLTKASQIINTPKPFFIPTADFTRIKMPFIKGHRLSETLSTYLESKQFQIMQNLGTQVAALHHNNIIHGDLTTSNIIFATQSEQVGGKVGDSDSKLTKAKKLGRASFEPGKLFIIDFGLGFISSRIEDKAVDIHLIKQALEAKHFQNHKQLFQNFLKTYKFSESKQVLEQLKKVEVRGRYKH